MTAGFRFLIYYPLGSLLKYVRSGGRSRGKQHRGLSTKTLMWGLRIRLEYRHKVSVRTEKHREHLLVWKRSIASQSDSNMLPFDQ